MTAFDTNDTPEQQPSLDSVASPERLDQLMRIVKPKDFIPVATMGGLTLTALIWSVVGRIPVTVNGLGVLISPQPVVELQSPVAGQLKSLLVKDNQCVKKGEVLATIQPIELEEQLKQQLLKRSQLLAQLANITTVEQQRMQVELGALAATRTSLNERLRDVQALSPVIKEQALENISQQRQTLQQRLQDKQALASVTNERELNTVLEQRRTMQQRLQDLKELEPVLKNRLSTRKQLQLEGGISIDTVLEAENAYRDNRNQISTIQTQLTELKSKEIEIEKSFRENRSQETEIRATLQQLDSQKITTEKSFRENRNSISEIEAQLQNLNTRSKQLEQDNLIASNTRKNEIIEVERTIAQTKQQIEERSQIRSSQSGCILSVSSTVGQVVSPGTRLGTLQPQATGQTEITSIVYFDVKDGKRIKSGMKMQITPDTVKRERFGGIVATVKSVSPYPVTLSTVATKVGNAELAETLTNKTAKVEVVASLVPESNNISGYHWSSSKGPDMKLTPGTTTAVRVKVEEQAPITFLLPFLREWSGIQ
jgi:HlyD family secretion protein